MKFFCARVTPIFLFASLLLSIAPEAPASKDRQDRQVYVTFVQGDVRISRGKGHHPDLNQSWEQAVGGELVEQGYALATGNGRAEIDFENGSTVYLAANSIVLFRELSAPGNRLISRMTLATGTATFSLQPANEEFFFINTPTDQLELSPPETFFACVDAYLDATAITPQKEKGDRVVRRGVPPFQIQKGETVFFRGGEVVQIPNRKIDVAAILAPFVSWESLLPDLPDSQTTPEGEVISEGSKVSPDLAASHVQGVSEWDTWVSERVQQRRIVTAAALKASGLSAPIPDLVDLYEHGKFFNCQPYGTCWEATDSGESQDYTPQSAAPIAQSAAPAQNQTQANVPFLPQTVQWEELQQGWCSPATFQTITRVAHAPQELQKLLRMKQAAQKARYSSAVYPADCENGYWIPYRHHYARVLTPQVPRHCVGARCKPIHAPRPVWVRVGNKVGFAPPHPNDVKGKPPINLKEGIIIPPSRPGEHIERVAVEPSQKVAVLNKAPREFRDQPAAPALHVAAPEIHAHLVQESARDKSFAASASAHPTAPITYDYKSHHFQMPASAVAGTKSREVAVGGIDSHGRVGSFADGHSGSYARSFGHTEAATSYQASTFSSSRGGYGGSYSGGSYSSGSHSSGSSSSGSSHSSGGR